MTRIVFTPLIRLILTSSFEFVRLIVAKKKKKTLETSGSHSCNSEHDCVRDCDVAQFGACPPKCTASHSIRQHSKEELVEGKGKIFPPQALGDPVG